jgi:hypothetical protein
MVENKQRSTGKKIAVYLLFAAVAAWDVATLVLAWTMFVFAIAGGASIDLSMVCLLGYGLIVIIALYNLLIGERRVFFWFSALPLLLIPLLGALLFFSVR